MSGSNGDGQLGTGQFGIEPTPVKISVPAKIVEAAAGLAHTLFLAYDGTVFSTGANSYG